MRKGTWQVVATFVLWGVLPVFWKALDALNPFYILASRIVWSLVFVCGVLFLRRRDSRRQALQNIRDTFRDRRELCLLLAAGVLVAINWGAYIWGVNTGRLVDTSLAYFLEPIVVMLFGAVFFREKLAPVQWAAIGVATLGVAYPLAESGEVPVLALVIAISFAVYSAIKKKVRSDGNTSLFFETLTMCVPALLWIVWMEARGQGAISTISGVRLLLVPMAGVVTTVPLMLFSKGIKTTSYALSGALMYINPILQLLLGLLYGETLTTSRLVTFGCTWVALTLFLLGGRRLHRM